MAKRIHYTYRSEDKVIAFANDRFTNMFEAIAAAEGIDLTSYLRMEQQVEMTSKDSKAVRDYRDQEFKRMGFKNIRFVKEK
ncbi:DUF2960 domain-containing protein [Echinimonas agarilytica]|uniref:DUF2960 domain-containing protein n=1 Tax=Echinimonas agarilytica TaxID=1215918 RepID=A0AA41W7S7_9GAMM|nr:DUF2960 domain-containing protein [Echinimonas agarilytica]MCM2680480.1 DUF2960 domain-containing protein [Echinimonas agarilytica]